MLLGTLTVALAVLAAVFELRPPAPPSVPVAVAARDLLPGRPLTADDVRAQRVDPAQVPDAAYAPDDVPFGRLIAGPARRGEPLTDLSVVGPELAGAMPTGQVLTAIAVRALPSQLVRVGDIVRVVATDPRGGVSGSIVAPAATVVVTPGEADPEAQTGITNGSTLVVSVPESQALALSAASTDQVLDVLVPGSPSR